MLGVGTGAKTLTIKCLRDDANPIARITKNKFVVYELIHFIVTVLLRILQA